uniref:Chitin-binding type-2 domain-containing protein n=1 Tax=Musca domestica TaxID=7370 RepID=A0A1I8M268_MUSDO
MKVYYLLVFATIVGPQLIGGHSPVFGLNYPVKRSPVDCSSCEDGELVADRSSCSSYYLCVGGQALRQTCGPGLLFDSRTRSCNLDYLVDCPVNRYQGYNDNDCKPHVIDYIWPFGSRYEEYNKYIHRRPPVVVPEYRPHVIRPNPYVTPSNRVNDETTTCAPTTVTTTNAPRTVTTTNAPRAVTTTTVTTTCAPTTAPTSCAPTSATTPCNSSGGSGSGGGSGNGSGSGSGSGGSGSGGSGNGGSGSGCSGGSGSGGSGSGGSGSGGSGNGNGGSGNGSGCNGIVTQPPPTTTCSTTTTCPTTTQSSSDSGNYNGNGGRNNANVRLNYLMSYNDCASLADNTILLDLKHCRRYYVCTNRRAKRVRCSIGQWYDKDAHSCRPRAEVTNCVANKN